MDSKSDDKTKSSFKIQNDHELSLLLPSDGEHYVLRRQEHTVRSEAVNYSKLSNGECALSKEEHEAGNVCATNNYAWHLFFGDGVDRDSQLAFRLFSKASEKGSLNALNNVGVCITCGFHDLSKTKQTETSNAYVLPGDGPKDDEKGAVMFLKAAEAGCLTALINIGTCYRTGDGLEKDLTKALERWNAAARRGSSEAKCKIGTLSLFAGETKIAIGYYEDAARSGIGEAMFGAGTCRLNENDRSIDDTTLAWFEQAAEAGYPEAHYFLCKRYRHGSGVRKDKPKAQRHLEIGAYLGEPSAQLIMASRYDDSEHIFWLMRSAEQGTFKAQYMLGCIYEKGEEGQTKDVMLALRWFHAAVQNGSELAKEEIEALRSEVD